MYPPLSFLRRKCPAEKGDKGKKKRGKYGKTRYAAMAKTEGFQQKGISTTAHIPSLSSCGGGGIGQI